jgi:hypothetical protein
MKLFIFSALMFSSLLSFAGPVVIGNGGNAIKIEDRFYLLDLAEQGIAQEPNFKANYSKFFHQYFLTRAMNYPNRFLGTTLDLFSQKLAELAELDPVYAESLITAFENTRWMFVNYRLNDIPVDSIIAGPYYQVAARTNDVILFDNIYWDNMDEKNRVALIIHELNYILIQPQTVVEVAVLKSAFKSRLQTGYLFTQNLEFIEPEAFSKRIDPLFPTRFDPAISQIDFYPFYFKNTRGIEKMAFNPYVLINGMLPGPRLAHTTLAYFQYSICEQNAFELQSAEIVGISIQQDIFNGDNNSQDSTSYVETRIPDFLFTRKASKSCKAEAERLYKDISAHLPGVF